MSEQVPDRSGRHEAMKSAIDRISDLSSVGDTAYYDGQGEYTKRNKALSDSEIKDRMYRKKNRIRTPAAKKNVPTAKKLGE
jgi:hypothetical protein